MNWWVWEEEKTQRQVWGTGRKTCLYTVLGGRSSLCLHLGVMGDQLPAESAERKRAHVPKQAPTIHPLTEGDGWKKNTPFFSWPATATEFLRRRGAGERRLADLHQQDLILKGPVQVPPYAAGVQVCFLHRGGLLREKDQGALWEIGPWRVDEGNTTSRWCTEIRSLFI